MYVCLYHRKFRSIGTADEEYSTSVFKGFINFKVLGGITTIRRTGRTLVGLKERFQGFRIRRYRRIVQGVKLGIGGRGDPRNGCKMYKK